MDILKVISRLMVYPSQELVDYAEELTAVIEAATEISPLIRTQISALLKHISDNDLMDVQEEYGCLFDRGRSLSLLLFEHVHGESRERGQAMVDLMSLYQKSGFHISVRELPDFIPLFLEFLAQRPDIEAREWLADVSHILGMLSARLQERESAYHSLFDALLLISGVSVDTGELREKAAAEERDDTPEAFDKVWEEEAVRFGGGANLDIGSDAAPCRPQTMQHSAVQSVAGQEQARPLHWVDASTKQGNSAQQ